MKLHANSRKGAFIFGCMVVLCVLLTLFALPNAAHQRSNALFSNPHISVINVVGTISPDDGYYYNQQWILDTIDDIINDDTNKGLLLYVDSPGGYVYDCDELYFKLLDYKQTTGRPIYVSIGSLGASAAYYISCTADKIYSNRNGLTGSIGVITSQHIDLSQFLGRYGINVTEIASGANKTMGSYFQPLTEEQISIYQTICNEYYDQFVEVVVKGRGLDESTVRTLGDGRVYTAKQALEHHLIDGIATFDEALSIFAKNISVSAEDTIYYQHDSNTGFFNQLLSTVSAVRQSTAQTPEERLLNTLTEQAQTAKGGFMYYYQP